MGAWRESDGGVWMGEDEVGRGCLNEDRVRSEGPERRSVRGRGLYDAVISHIVEVHYKVTDVKTH